MAAQTSVNVALLTGAAKDDLFNQRQVTEDSAVANLNVLANDPGSAKVWSLYQDQKTLNLASGSNVITLASGAKISINADGTIKYDASGVAGLNALSASESFTDTFTYTARMANGALSVATVKVVVGGANDAATISYDTKSATLVEDGGQYVAGGTLQVHDVDHGEARFAAVDPAALQGSYGSFSFDSATGKWGYTLNNDSAAVQGLKGGQEAFESLTVTSLDGTASETIQVKVVGSNDAPILTGATATLAAGTEDTAYTLHASDLLAGYTDVDGDTLSVTGLTASHGTLTDNHDGTWTFTPEANYNGAVELSYGITDGRDTIDALQGFTLAPVDDTFAFGFTVSRTQGATVTDTTTSTQTLAYTGAPPTDQNLFSQQYSEWVRSLSRIGHDTNGDGVVTTAWHQNSATNTVEIEGVALTFQSSPYAITTGNTTQTRYYVNGLTAVTTSTTTSTTPGALTVTATDAHAFTIDNFQVGSDRLSFAGVNGLSADEFNSVFTMNQADVTGDGIPDTTIALTGSSWSVTLAGVHNATLSSLIAA